MDIRILTIFPEMFAPLEHSMIGRARAQGLLRVETVDIRAFSKNKHHNTDDYPFGGGAGMVMLAQPIMDAMAHATQPPFQGPRVYLSPRGETLTQRKAERLARYPGLSLLCGHYEGVDERALDACVDESLSIGDYVLTGGELAAMVLVDCVARLLPGVLGSAQSPLDESFSSAGLLEYPQYTRPREIDGRTVPEVLLSGDHAKIAAWRREQALRQTWLRRPDMLAHAPLTEKEKRLLALWEAERAALGIPASGGLESGAPSASVRMNEKPYDQSHAPDDDRSGEHPAKVD